MIPGLVTQVNDKLKRAMLDLRTRLANLRCFERRPHSATAIISWKDCGELITVFARSRDLSRGGIGVVSPECFDYGRTVRIDMSGQVRHAVVRHSRREAEGFAIGFEFIGDPGVAPIRRMSELELALEGINY